MINELDKKKGIVEVFLDTVKRYPQNTALVYNQKEYSYHDLNVITNRLAKGLKLAGVKEGSVVMIYLPHNDTFICSLLALLKCNCTYVPVDFDVPADRVNLIIKNSEIEYVVCQEQHENIHCSHKLFYEELISEVSDFQYTSNESQMDKGAYIIYTSGTTGEPKGIEIKQKAVLNLVNTYSKYFAQKSDMQQMRILVMCSFGFDMSVLQIYCALLKGNTLDVLPIDGKENIGLFLDFVKKHKIDATDVTPLFLDAIGEYVSLNNLNQKDKLIVPQYFISSGEALPLSVVQKVYKNKEFLNSIILNSYGPSESCVYTTVFPVTYQNYQTLEKVPIGKTLDNMRVYIMKDNNHVCEPGDVGEIYIAGIGIANEYYKNKSMSEKCFVHLKCLPEEQVLYKTGDYGYHGQDGTVYYVGRQDDQIKRRGYRIELDDIKCNMLKLSSVKKCEVLVKGDSKNKKIVAYYISDQELSVSFLNIELSKRVPAYMLPDYYVPVKQFYRTKRGKLDKSKLADYTEYVSENPDDLGKCYENGEFLEGVIEIIKEMLNLDHIKASNNFFTIGGNSIYLYSFIAQAESRWKIQLLISELLQTGTMGEIAGLVQAKVNKKNTCDLKKNSYKNETLGMTTPFQRMIISQEKKSIELARKHKIEMISNYNVVYQVVLDDIVDARKLKTSLDCMVEKIDSLNICFAEHDGVLKMESSITGKDNYFEIKTCESIHDVAKLKKNLKNFDVKAAPLFQVILFTDACQEQCLLFNFHHAIFDYYSLHILMRMLLNNYYHIKDSREEGITFMNYVNSHNLADRKEAYKFWNRYYTNRAMQTYIYGDILKNGTHKMIYFKESQFEVKGELLESIKNLQKRTGISKYLFTFVVYGLCISSMLGLEDTIIGTYINARGQEGQNDLNTIGLITSLVGIRFNHFMNRSILDFLSEVNRDFVEVVKNIVVDFNEVYNAMSEEDMTKGKLFNTIFNYIVQGKFCIGNTKYSYQFKEIGEEPVSIPFSIKGFEEEDRIKFKLKYCSQIYSEEFCDVFVSNYLHFLDVYSKDDDVTIGSVTYEE